MKYSRKKSNNRKKRIKEIWNDLKKRRKALDSVEGNK
jgi:hypothetical protein